jgi:hypothetical protein
MDGWIDVYLFIDSVSVSEYDVTSQKARNESICTTLFAICFALYKEKSFVQGYKLGKVERVLFCCTIDKTETLLPTFSLVIGMINRNELHTHSPRPKRIDMTRAWGNLTFAPYTKPLRAPFKIARRSWYAGFVTICWIDSIA